MKFKKKEIRYLRNRELAFTWAVISIKRFRRNDPFAPAYIGKIYFEIAPRTRSWFIPLLPPCLFQGLLIKLERLALRMTVFSGLFLTLCPFCQPWLQGFVVLPLLPSFVLTILILGSWKLVVLQGEKEAGGTLGPLSTEVTDWPAVQFGGRPRRRIPMALQARNHALRFWNGGVVGIDKDVGFIAEMEALPRRLANRGHLDPDHEMVALLCSAQVLSDVFALPQMVILQSSRDVDQVTPQGPRLVCWWRRTEQQKPDL